jgi:arylsulfatase A-like enzyme
VKNAPLPNIVLLVLDTLRPDRLASYGYQREVTPNLDAYAAQGTIFERAIATAQWSTPSHTSIFTGEYPTTHMTNQATDRLSPTIPTMTQYLRRRGYHTVAFCNNPLVGMLNNGLQRGFFQFFNYAGAMPTVPRRSSSWPWPFKRAHQFATQNMRRIAYHSQNAFAHSDFLFQLSMQSFMVNIWTRVGNFKGNTAHSILDMAEFIRNHPNTSGKKPFFLFANLMEVHLPHRPPEKYVSKFAPYLKTDRPSRDFLRYHNSHNYRWMAPLPAPYKPEEYRILNDMYDAEVNYQDELLAPLFELLSQPGYKDNTLVIITSDHGESLGEHSFVGHNYVAYDELAHVPLIIVYPPSFSANYRVSGPVSLRRIFHTALDAANIEITDEKLPSTDVKELSLASAKFGSDGEKGMTFCEAYPPLNHLRAMEHMEPELIEKFRLRSVRRAIYEHSLKLICMDDEPAELYDLERDAAETHNLIDERKADAQRLSAKMDKFLEIAEKRRPSNWQEAQKLKIEDETVINRLKALGYIE